MRLNENICQYVAKAYSKTCDFGCQKLSAKNVQTTTKTTVLESSFAVPPFKNLSP